MKVKKVQGKKGRQRKYTAEAIRKDFKKNKVLLLIAAPMIIYTLIFNYLPMGGLLMAFQDFKPIRGLWGSEWVGLKHFYDFFSSVWCKRVIWNTICISVKDLIISFPLSIIFALLLNEVKNKYFNKFVQTVTYMPYFISMVVIAGLILNFCGEGGMITNIFNSITGHEGSLMADPDCFQGVYVGSNVWQTLGFNSVIFIASLSGIDQELYEAAQIDGATRLRQVWHITLPGIANTIIIMLILKVGMLMSVGSDKIILLYNSLTLEKADVINSFVYRRGLIDGDYGFSTAVGLFNSVINLVLIVVTNQISKKYSETSLF